VLIEKFGLLIERFGVLIKRFGVLIETPDRAISRTRSVPKGSR
jgi:hypothetical protein